MLKFLKNALRRSGPSSASVTATDLGDFLDRATIPRYPPYREGLPVASAEQIVETQPELLSAIDRSLGFPKPEFRRLIYPVICRYAGYVHLLPASEKHHHRLAGGLFRHGLEVAKYTSRASEGIVWVLGESPQERRRSEPRWRVAAFLAGLLHDVGKTISDMVVVTAEGAEWNPFEGDIPTWAGKQQASRYFIHWRPNRLDKHRTYFGHLRDKIMGDELAAWMHEGDPEAASALMVLLDSKPESNRLTALMSEGDRWSVEKDLGSSKADAESGSLTNLTAPQVMIRDAAQRLIADRTWKVNVPGARVWVIGAGKKFDVFVVWKKATEEVLQLLQTDGVTGIPSGPDLLADDLIDRNVAEGRNGFRYWPIQPEILANNGRSPVLLTLKILNPQWLFGDAPIPAPIAAFIGTEEERVAAAAGPGAGTGEGDVAAVARTGKTAQAAPPISKGPTKTANPAPANPPTREKVPLGETAPSPDLLCPECGAIIHRAPTADEISCGSCGCVFRRNAEGELALDVQPHERRPGPEEPPPASEEDYFREFSDQFWGEQQLAPVMPNPEDMLSPGIALRREIHKPEMPAPEGGELGVVQEDDAAETARAMFTGSPGGRIVLKLVEQTRRKGWGTYLVLSGRDVSVPYVSALNGFKRFERKPDQKDLAPHDILKLWADLGWLEADKYDPTRYQHEAGGAQFLKFKRNIADAIRALDGARLLPRSDGGCEAEAPPPRIQVDADKAKLERPLSQETDHESGVTADPTPARNAAGPEANNDADTEQFQLFTQGAAAKPWRALSPHMRSWVERFLEWLDEQSDVPMSECGRRIVTAEAVEGGKNAAKLKIGTALLLRMLAGHPRVEVKDNVFLVKDKDQ